MIPPEEYAARRERVMRDVGEGIVFLQGASVARRNPSCDLPFRQDSMVRYLAPIEVPDASILLVPKENKFVLFAPEPDLDSMLWTGEVPSLEELAESVGADEVHPNDPGTVERGIKQYSKGGKHRDRDVHSLLGLSGPFDDTGFCEYTLARSLVEQRLVKSPAEVREIEKAVEVAAAMYQMVSMSIDPDTTEREIFSTVMAVCASRGATFSFQPIVSVDGYVLHNSAVRDDLLDEKRLLLVDAGAELLYDSDITRVFPVNETFSAAQREVYEIVLTAQESAIASMRPGKNFREIHLETERVLAEGLVQIGVLRGGVDEVLEARAHRLFFSHGLGHALGLDCHDCEDYENMVAGYDVSPRSGEFGLKKLRFARDLVPGNVMTVEPGLYFNPLVIYNPEHYVPGSGKFLNGKLAHDLSYEVGGIRIEDDVLVTENGSRVLSAQIPKSIEGIEDPF